MDPVLGLQLQKPPRFRTRRSLRLRPTTWMRWLGYLALVMTVLETYSYLSVHPELSLLCALVSYQKPGILRPGQYRDPDGIEYVFVPGETEVEDRREVDDMGFVHARRDIRFYIGGTLTLTSSDEFDSPDPPHPKPSIYDPYPRYNSRKWKKENEGVFQPCLGPRGRDLDRTRLEDMMLVYKGNQIGFPESQFGSFEAMDLDGNVCTDRYSRFGAYGYDEMSEEDVPGFTRPPQVPWSEVDWHELQSLCFERNVDRYRPGSATTQTQERPLSFELRRPPQKTYDSYDTPLPGQKRYHNRSALLIRSWHTMTWTENHRQYLRALIMELSLHSGGEYEVFLLVHVNDDDLPIFSDTKTMNRLRNSIPAEFRSMALFFNNKLLEAWYPKIAEHSPILQHHQPLEIFSQLYPNFDFYWQLEMDGRHTGHVYHFLDKVVSFARKQPRKYLWERNAYFYTPGEHGTWDQFTRMVDESLAEVSDNTVWGPIFGTGIRSLGPSPATARPKNDNYTWGVGEEADMITFLPIFNPKDTAWTFPDIIWNFRYGIDTPRRAAVITMGRYSKRLLDLIHNAQAAKGLGLASEMTGASWAMYHGLKAVHVPHPIYADGQWTSEELARIYNRGVPENINGGPDSIWNFDHIYDHIMYRLSYMFTTHTAEDMFRRWMGFRTAANEGGKRRFAMVGIVFHLCFSTP
ncbi:unnamed protein product [Penicillium manginii]